MGFFTASFSFDFASCSLKIRDLIPLMLLIIALENIFRAGIGQYKSLIISSAPPGALTPLIGLVTLIFFFISIRENK